MSIEKSIQQNKQVTAYVNNEGFLAFYLKGYPTNVDYELYWNYEWYSETPSSSIRKVYDYNQDVEEFDDSCHILDLEEVIDYVVKENNLNEDYRKNLLSFVEVHINTYYKEHYNDAFPYVISTEVTTYGEYFDEEGDITIICNAVDLLISLYGELKNMGLKDGIIGDLIDAYHNLNL